jgi:ketosteroid isomerase-like protein
MGAGWASLSAGASAAAEQSAQSHGGSPGCDARAALMAEKQQVVIKALEALSSGNYEGFLNQLSEDVRFYMVGAGVWVGRQAVRELTLRATSSIDSGGYREEIVSIIVEGDVVAVQSRGHEKTKAGLDYNNEYLVFYTVRNGKIVETRSHSDIALTNRVKFPVKGS